MQSGPHFIADYHRFTCERYIKIIRLSGSVLGPVLFLESQEAPEDLP